MSVSETAKDLISTVNKLGALEARTSDVAKNQERIEAKLDTLIDRLARIEANYENLRANVKNEVMSEIGRELTRVQVILDLQTKGLLPSGVFLGRPELEQRKVADAVK
jgi:molecular chaperone GrpE (heat shock protein)